MNPELSYAKIYRDGTYVMYSGGGGNAENVRAARDIQAQKPRKFRVNRAKLRSATLSLWDGRRSKTMLFLTVTIERSIPEKQVARAWNLWLKNLQTNRKLRRFVWVKERQQNENIHYHILLDLPYVSIKYMQRAWETSIYSVTGLRHIYHCSVRLGKRPVVYNPQKVSRYLAKYVTKSTDEFSMRAYGHSDLEVSYRVDATDLHHFLSTFRTTVYLTENFLIVGRMDIAAVPVFLYRYGAVP